MTSNTQTNNIDTTRGQKKYDSKVKNIEGIFSKVGDLLDLTTYKKEFNDIINSVKDDPTFSNRMTYQFMQMDYEGFIYDKYSAKLDELINKLDIEVLPFYELYLLNYRVNNNLSNVSCENINEIIDDTKRLINSLNGLNTHNEKDKNKIIDSSYKTIYSVILYEELFEKSDILSYIKKINLPINIENLGRLLSKDLKLLDKDDLVDIDLSTLKKEGLGYDYLDENIIKKISNKTVGETNSEYQERKKQVIDDLEIKVSKLEVDTKSVNEKINDYKNRISKLHNRKRILVSKMFSLALIPVIFVSAGHTIGKNKSNKIIEYKTITRTIDADTGLLVGEISEIYDDKETTYVATVLEEGPWILNKSGGYIRNVKAYEYIAPTDANSVIDFNNPSFYDNLREKYKYVEAKEKLDENDSISKSTLLITETYQDKNDSRKSTKYTLEFTIISAFVGIMIDIAVLFLRIFGYEEAKYRLREINNSIDFEKIHEDELKEELNNLKQYYEQLRKEYNNSVKKYGSLGNKFIFDDLKNTEFKKLTKKLK